MKNVILLDKPISLTPLQAIERFKKENTEYENEKMSYAGRLDPMARGLLVVLVGEENKKREKYEGVDKEYEFELLFGVSTDSYDVMGKLKEPEFPDYPDNLENKIRDNMDDFRGKFKQKYPPFSSYTIEGKPLFWWARENKLDQIEIPKKEVEVKTLEVLSSYEIESGQLLEEITNRISAVEGDFRQEEILAEWVHLLEKDPEFMFKVFKFKAAVTAGTYIRSIAHELGQKLNTGAIAFDILRTKVGEYKLEDAVKIIK